MDKALERLLREQNFNGKAVCLFSSDPSVKPAIEKKMALSVSEGDLVPCDYCVFWLADEKDSLVKSAARLIKGKGKLVFLRKGRIQGNLKDILWDEGFLITRHYVAKIAPTEGVSYARAKGEKTEYIFIVASKVNFS